MPFGHRFVNGFHLYYIMELHNESFTEILAYVSFFGVNSVLLFIPVKAFTAIMTIPINLKGALYER